MKKKKRGISKPHIAFLNYLLCFVYTGGHNFNYPSVSTYHQPALFFMVTKFKATERQANLINILAISLQKNLNNKKNNTKLK